MWYVMKIGQDNNMTNRISAIYVENNYELSWPMGPSAICDENMTEQQCDQLYKCAVYIENDTELS